MEDAFHAVYGVDLEQVWPHRTWRWFRVRVERLLSRDSPLARHFAPPPDASPPTGE